MTDAEQLLWFRLRRKQVNQLQFYRQKPLLGFVVDFYCPVATLVIEVDGAHHFEKTQKDDDEERTKMLKSLGLEIIRFNNREVLTNIESVMQSIEDVTRRKIPPNPPFSKGGIKTYG